MRLLGGFFTVTRFVDCVFRVQKDIHFVDCVTCIFLAQLRDFEPRSNIHIHVGMYRNHLYLLRKNNRIWVYCLVICSLLVLN